MAGNGENQVTMKKGLLGWLLDMVVLIILPSYMGIIVNHYKDPGSLLNKQYFNGK